MATVGLTSTIGVPGSVDNFGTAITVNGKENNRLRADAITLFNTNSSLEMVDTTLVCDRFNHNDTINGTTEVLSMTNSRVQFTVDSADNISSNWFGTNTFDGATFQLNSDNSNTIYTLGGGGSGNWNIVSNGSGLRFVNYSRGQLVLHGSGLRSVTGSGAISLIGNTFSQSSAQISIYNIAAADSASTSAFDDAYAAGFGYSYRMAHQAGLSNSVNLILEGTGGRAALYTDFDLSNVVKTGSQEYTTTSVTTSIRQSVIQMNRQAVWWMLDPIMGNGPGEANDGNTLNVGYHTNNPPGGAGVSSDAELRMFISDRIVGRDASTGGVVDGEFKIRYSAPVRLMPEDWDVNNLPLETANNDIVFDQDSTDTDPTPHNGAMVQAYRRRYGLGATSDVADSLTNTEAGRNPAIAGNTFNALPTNITRTLRHFDFDFAYSTLVEPNYTGGSSGLVTMNERRMDGVDLSPYLNGRTATTALLSSISDFADIVPSIRRAFYEGSPLGGMPVVGSGTTLTFDRDIGFSSTSSTTYTGTFLGIGISAGTTTITGDNTTFSFGSNSVNWTSHRVPSGLTLDGGQHLNLNTDISFGAYNVSGTINLFLNASSATYVGLDGVLGDITYLTGASVSIANNVPITVQINEEDIPSALNYVLGSNSLGTGITREDAIVMYTIRPAGTIEEIRDRGGFWGRKRIGDANTTIVAITSTTDLDDVTESVEATTDRDFIAFYKPANVIKVGDNSPLAYEVSSLAYNPSTMTENLTVGAVTFSTLLTDTALPLPAGLNVFTERPIDADIPLGLESGSLNVILNRSITTSGETLTHAMSVANGSDYFRVVGNNEITWQLLEIGINNQTIWNDTSSRPDLETRDFVYFSSQIQLGETFPTQKTVRQADLVTQSPDGFLQVLSLIEGTATLVQVTQAARIGIETSATATDVAAITTDVADVEILVSALATTADLATLSDLVDDVYVDTQLTVGIVPTLETDLRRVRNGVGYVVSGSSKLIGLKPKAIDYVAGTTTYEGEL